MGPSSRASRPPCHPEPFALLVIPSEARDLVPFRESHRFLVASLLGMTGEGVVIPSAARDLCPARQGHVARRNDRQKKAPAGAGAFETSVVVRLSRPAASGATSSTRGSRRACRWSG